MNRAVSNDVGYSSRIFADYFAIETFEVWFCHILFSDLEFFTQTTICYNVLVHCILQMECLNV